RQGLRKIDEILIFGLVPRFAPAGMVAILLSSPRIASRRLQMAIRIGTNPHLFPCRRNDQRPDSREARLAAHLATVGPDVFERSPAANAPDPRLRVLDVLQTGPRGGSPGFGCIGAPGRSTLQ